MNNAELVGLLVDENTMEIKRRKRETYLVIKRGLDIVISFLKEHNLWFLISLN